MLSFSANQLAILVLVLVLGWLLGLLTRSGAARWRRAARDEQAARIRAEEQLAAANARIVELEGGIRPVGAGTRVVVSAVPTDRRDDLAVIRGVGREREALLNEHGVHRYTDVERLTEADVSALEAKLALPAGTIAREQWREQAATLRNEGAAAHRTRWG